MPLIVSKKDASKYGATQDAAGNYVVKSSGGGSSSGSPSTTNTPSTPSTSTPPSTTSSVDYSALDKELASSNLSEDEKKAIRATYAAVYNNDQAEAERLIANLQLGKTYADPLLKQKVALMTDELKRSYSATGEDLQYNEETLYNRLNDLRQDIATQRGNLTLEEQSQLRDLERQYTQQLENLQDSLMAAGFTNSSRRNVRERVLAETRGDMVESTRRKFATAQQEAADALARGERDTAAEVERLRQLTERSRTNLVRNAEGQLGSERVGALPELSGVKPLGAGTNSITGQVDLDYQKELSAFIF